MVRGDGQRSLTASELFLEPIMRVTFLEVPSNSTHVSRTPGAGWGGRPWAVFWGDGHTGKGRGADKPEQDGDSQQTR